MYAIESASSGTPLVITTFFVFTTIWSYFTSPNDIPMIVLSENPWQKDLGRWISELMFHLFIHIEEVTDCSSTLELYSYPVLGDSSLFRTAVETMHHFCICHTSWQLKSAVLSWLSALISIVPLSSGGRTLVSCWLCIASRIHRTICMTLSHRCSYINPVCIQIGLFGLESWAAVL